MKLDKYNLLIDDDGDISKAALNTAKFFIESKFKKEEIDRTIISKDGPRKKTKDESFEEYDDYLTAYTRVYEDMLNKKNLGYLMTLDINFNYVCQTLASPGIFNKHPDIPTSRLDNKDATYMMAACLLYDFSYYSALIDRSNIHIKAMSNGRSTWHRYASDLKLLLTKDTELVTILKEVSKRYNPTFLTKYL